MLLLLKIKSPGGQPGDCERAVQDLDQWRRAASAKLDSLQAQTMDLQHSLSSQQHHLQKKLQELSELMQSQQKGQQQTYTDALQRQQVCRT